MARRQHHLVVGHPPAFVAHVSQGLAGRGVIGIDPDRLLIRQLGPARQAIFFTPPPQVKARLGVVGLELRAPCVVLVQDGPLLLHPHHAALADTDAAIGHLDDELVAVFDDTAFYHATVGQVHQVATGRQGESYEQTNSKG